MMRLVSNSKCSEDWGLILKEMRMESIRRPSLGMEGREMSTLLIWSTNSRGSFMRITSGRLYRSFGIGGLERCREFLALEGLF
jgi:hypothetical protein